MNKDLPTTLDSMERAGLEFEELGQSLNILTGGLVRRNKPANARKAVAKAQAAAAAANTEIGMHEEALTSNVDNKGSSAIHEWNAVEALQAGTLASIRKVAQDVSSLTAVSSSDNVTRCFAWSKYACYVLPCTTLPGANPNGVMTPAKMSPPTPTPPQANCSCLFAGIGASNGCVA